MAWRATAGGLAAGLLLLAPVQTAGAEVRQWSVVPARSEITMRLTAFGAAQSGRFADWSGDIRFDPAAPEAARVAIDVRAASLHMGQIALTRRAVGPGFLEVEQYPSIVFRLTSLERAGPTQFTARANVTMKGRTRPVVFPVVLRVEGDTAQMSGGFSLDRAAFDIGTRGPWNAVIGRQVRVDVSLVSRAS